MFYRILHYQHDIAKRIHERRLNGDYAGADRLRNNMLNRGFSVQSSRSETVIVDPETIAAIDDAKNWQRIVDENAVTGNAVSRKIGREMMESYETWHRTDRVAYRSHMNLSPEADEELRQQVMERGKFLLSR